jgi:hypothetical protein
VGWEKIAKKAKYSIIGIYNRNVDSAMEEDEESSHGREVVREMDTLWAENEVLRDYFKQKITVLDKYERELKRYRSQAF